MTRHFLTMTDLSVAELRSLLHRAAELKQRPAAAKPVLAGRTVALVFQKPSMRTRVAFEVAVLRLGGAAIYLGQDDIQLGQREPIQDVARVLSRYVDGIVVRTFGHADVEAFARYARCPVINGLSDAVHPCQALADLLTIQEAFGRLKALTVAYVGDGNNVLHSLVQGCAMLGLSLSAATPTGYRPNAALWAAAARDGKRHGATIAWTSHPAQAVRGADVVYTDVWTSMGQERERAVRLKAFRGYQINRSLLAKAKPGARIMHCLPAHRGEEITDDVMEHRRSLIFDQAENRLHAHAALLEFLFRR
ncbi:MAG: ornithine carbamoyltransferase [Candidatus Omnitrophica bacterium CG11_big_fil_rev_8_21_14_0_20_63_9]|nr:MAG: ornithine carbamoyltransferase [Candidatus Omnitrophica bacterium CG11_big_fil_rev_8_21_14_0_20_63_9]